MRKRHRQKQEVHRITSHVHAEVPDSRDEVFVKLYVALKKNIVTNQSLRTA